MPYRELKHNNMLIVIDDVVRTVGPAGEDLFKVALRVANPDKSIGGLRRGPFIALRDGTGRLIEPVGGDEVAEPVRPGDTVSGSINFEMEQDAGDIQMVLAPGTEDEVAIDLPDIPRGSR